MIKNIIGTFFTRTFVAVIMLASLIISTRFLGSAVVGQFSLLILNIAIIQAIAEVYSGSALVYFIPRSPFKKIYFIGLGWIFLCTTILNFIFYFFRIGVPELGLHVLILSLLASLHGFHNFLLLGKEKIKIYNLLIFIQPATYFLILLFQIFYIREKSVFASIVALYTSYGLSFIISTMAVTTSLTSCANQQPFIFKNIIRNGFINQLGNLAHILSNRYNYYIIEAISISLVGVYASATSLIESVWIISASVSPLILTHIANRRDTDNNSKLTFLLAKLCFILTFICIVILFFIPNEFFTAILGKDFSQAKTVMLYLSPGALAISFSSILSHYFSGLGEQKVLLKANATGLVVTLLTSYFFISRYGIIGACYTASLAYFMQALVLTWIFVSRNKIKMRSLFYLRKDFQLLK